MELAALMVISSGFSIIVYIVCCFAPVLATKGEIKEYLVGVEKTVIAEIRLNEYAKNIKTYGINLADVAAFDKLATSHLENPVF